MYQKIMDKLDVIMMRKQLTDEQTFVADRMYEIIDTLDGAYGTNRKSGDMGGFILFFEQTENMWEDLEEIIMFYGIKPNMYEYKEVLADRENVSKEQFVETLYLIGSDNAIVIIQPLDGCELL